MSRIRDLLAGLLFGCLLALTCGAPPVQAACLVLPARHVSAAEARALAQTVEDALKAKDAGVALVFRVGLPRAATPKDLLFSQGGLWVRVNDDAGPHFQTYDLVQGQGGKTRCDRSVLTEDTPEGFFGWAVEPRAAVLIPTAAMQARLVAVVRSPTYAALHNPDYSLVANPFEPKHQNAAGFLLRLIEAARLDTSDAGQIDAAIRREFKPTLVKLNPFERAVGGTIGGRLTLDDQRGAIQTAAFDSLAGYMAAKGLLAEPPAYLSTR